MKETGVPVNKAAREHVVPLPTRTEWMGGKKKTGPGPVLFQREELK